MRFSVMRVVVDNIEGSTFKALEMKIKKGKEVRKKKVKEKNYLLVTIKGYRDSNYYPTISISE